MFCFEKNEVQCVTFGSTNLPFENALKTNLFFLFLQVNLKE